MIHGDIYLGSLILLADCALQWNINTSSELHKSNSIEDTYQYPLSIHDLTTDYFSLFKYLKPKPSLVLVGTGPTLEQPSREIIDYLDTEFESYEILSTRHAVSTFNLLNLDNRSVAAAVISVD